MSHDIDLSARHRGLSRLCTTMPGPASYNNRQAILLSKIYSLFQPLSPSTYNEVAPKVEYWIEWALAEHSTTVDELVDRVAVVAWDHATCARVATKVT